jgi:preprotein translocase subunit YajC
VPTLLASIPALLAQADGSALGGNNGVLILLPAFLAIFYFMIIRPQQKEQKKLQSMLGGLKKGDEVLTNGGLIGRIDKVEGNVLTIDFGTTKIRVVKGQVAGLYSPQAEDGKAEPKESKDSKDAKPESSTDKK